MLQGYIVAIMRSINIADLKNTLSAQLRRVRKGETLLVKDRDQVIARIEPSSGRDSASPDDALSQLEARGLVKRGRGVFDLASFARRPRVKANLLAALLQDRAEGR